MTFRANSMTFKIYPEYWDAMPDYRLKRDFEEFIRWFGFNVNDMKKEEAAAGWKLAVEFKNVLEERGLSTDAYLDLPCPRGITGSSRTDKSMRQPLYK